MTSAVPDSLAKRPRTAAKYLDGNGDKWLRLRCDRRRRHAFSVENVTKVFDLHATILQLLGLDHKKLTYRFGGRDASPAFTGMSSAGFLPEYRC